MSHQIFYWEQEDHLRERASVGGWAVNILRPQLILGNALGSPMNLVAAIGVYAAVRRELGLALSFPGGGTYVTACADSRLIARATEFCATTPSAWGETFNVVNGDGVVWRDLWPAIAEHFRMSLGVDEETHLAVEMPRHAAVWERVVTAHGLRRHTMEAIVGTSWQFADLTFGTERSGHSTGC